MKKRLISLLLILVLCLTSCEQLLQNFLPKEEKDPEDLTTKYTELTPSKYVSIADEYYKSLDVHINCYNPVEVELEHYLAVALNEYKPKNIYENDDPSYVPIITAGDEVTLYYRGYMLNEDGSRNYVNGMDNLFHESYSSHKLTIGGGDFIPGFETALIGKSLNDYPKLEHITSGQIEKDYLVGCSVRTQNNGNIAFYSSVTIDLSSGREAVDEKYGSGVYDALVGSSIGESLTVEKFIHDNKILENTTLQVQGAINSNSYEGYTPIMVRFPIQYGDDDLNCKFAWFEIYVESITEYYDDSKGEGLITDDFVKNKVFADPRNELIVSEIEANYPNLSPLEQYKTHLRRALEENYNAIYDNMVYEEILEYYAEKATILKHPEALQEKTRSMTYNAFLKACRDWGTVIEAEDKIITIYTNYSDMNEFAKKIFPDQPAGNWRDMVKYAADRNLEKNLIALYILDREGINVTEELIEDATIAFILESYEGLKSYYLYLHGKEEDDYSGKEDLLREEVISFSRESIFSDDAIIQRLAIEYVLDNFNVTVHTLD